MAFTQFIKSFSLERRMLKAHGLRNYWNICNNTGFVYLWFTVKCVLLELKLCGIAMNSSNSVFFAFKSVRCYLYSSHGL